MAKIKPNKQTSERIARKITPIFDLILGLTEEEIEYLKFVRQPIEDEQSELRAVEGILVDMDKAEAKIKLGKQAIKRINGIISIWEAVKETPEIQFEYMKSKQKSAEIEKMFGL